MTNSTLEPGQKEDVYTTLVLFQAVLSLCFEVMNRNVLSTAADDLYVYLEMRGALDTQLGKIRPLLDKKLPRKMLPESISSMSNAEYTRLQSGFGIIKTFAKTAQVHGSEVDPVVMNFVAQIEDIKNGVKIKTDVSLAASEISGFEYATQSININGAPVHFSGAQEVYFLWAMFKKQCGESFSWDIVLEDIDSKFHEEQAYKNGSQSMKQAMYRINAKIKVEIGTQDLFFTYKHGGFTRNFGPTVE